MRDALLAILLLSPSALSGQSRWDREVDARLTQASRSLGHEYHAAGIAGRGALNTDETAVFSITLPAGAALALTGVCDDDCADLDLSLSTNGYEVDAARGGGNAPIVQVTPAATTTYRVTIRMGTCRLNPCWYAVGVFRQVVTTAPRSRR